jgi:hypothetical protein
MKYFSEFWLPELPCRFISVLVGDDGVEVVDADVFVLLVEKVRVFEDRCAIGVIFGRGVKLSSFVGGRGEDDLDFDRSLDEMLSKIFRDGEVVSLREVVVTDEDSKLASLLNDVVVVIYEMGVCSIGMKIKTYSGRDALVFISFSHARRAFHLCRRGRPLRD